MIQTTQQVDRSPLRGKYLIRNTVFNMCLRFADFILEGFISSKPINISGPNSILFTNIAHLGDVLIATSVLPAIRRSFPNAKIGFLVGSWSSQLLKTHPMVDVVHKVDHWKLNRSNNSFATKIYQYIRTRNRALKEIRQESYDIAIDLYFYFPNSTILLWQSGIPIRIGYSSAGFGPLLTHAVDWRYQKNHIVDYHRDLLMLLPICDGSLKLMRPVLSRSSGALIRRCFESLSIRDSEYIIAHIGTGALFREWPIEYWRDLAIRLQDSGIQVVFTGSGMTEFDKIESIVDGVDGCINACNKLTWNEYVEVVAGAKVLVGVESLAGHLAAAVDTPCIVIKSGATSDIWRPFGDLVTVLSHPVFCAPCYLKNGCEAMDCVRNIKVDDVYREIIKY